MFRENVTMEKVTLNQKEQNRLQVLNKVNLKQISIGQAAVLMQVSLRHTKRLLAGYRINIWDYAAAGPVRYHTIRLTGR